MASISSRKEDHLDLCAKAQVEFKHKTTLLEEVELLHDSLPELTLEEINLNTHFVQRKLKAPLLITGMTGGAKRAQSINRELARVAQDLGLAFGVGSQRAILRHAKLAKTYQVRDIAPDIALLGNIGAVQAATMTTSEAQDLVDIIDADALCIHLNPGQELMQPEGDRDFRGCLDAITRLCAELQAPVIIKETGCGLSIRTLEKLKTAGVSWIDVSGAGGTTWIGVEVLRTPREEHALGDLLWEWGTPTAASISWGSRRGFHVIGTGGLRNGMDVAKAIAMGASIAGMALPWLKAIHSGGAEQGQVYGTQLIQALRTIMLLTGSQHLDALQQTPRILGPKLLSWLRQDPLNL